MSAVGQINRSDRDAEGPATGRVETYDGGRETDLQLGNHALHTALQSGGDEAEA
jgi:hypothetical protein